MDFNSSYDFNGSLIRGKTWPRIFKVLALLAATIVSLMLCIGFFASADDSAYNALVSSNSSDTQNGIVIRVTYIITACLFINNALLNMINVVTSYSTVRTRLHALSLMLSIVCTVAYGLMANSADPVQSDSFDRPHSVQRLVEWAFSTPLLIIFVGELVPGHANQVAIAIAADAGMLGAGALAFFVHSGLVWYSAWMIIGTAFMCVLLLTFWKLLNKAAEGADSLLRKKNEFMSAEGLRNMRRNCTPLAHRSWIHLIKYWSLVSWSMYPLLAVLAASGVLGVVATEIWYSVLDINAKIIFCQALILSQDPLMDMHDKLNASRNRIGDMIVQTEKHATLLDDAFAVIRHYAISIQKLASAEDSENGLLGKGHIKNIVSAADNVSLTCATGSTYVDKLRNVMVLGGKAQRSTPSSSDGVKGVAARFDYLPGVRDLKHGAGNATPLALLSSIGSPVDAGTPSGREDAVLSARLVDVQISPPPIPAAFLKAGTTATPRYTGLPRILLISEDNALCQLVEKANHQAHPLDCVASFDRAVRHVDKLGPGAVALIILDLAGAPIDVGSAKQLKLVAGNPPMLGFDTPMRETVTDDHIPDAAEILSDPAIGTARSGTATPVCSSPVSTTASCVLGSASLMCNRLLSRHVSTDELAEVMRSMTVEGDLMASPTSFATIVEFS